MFMMGILRILPPPNNFLSPGLAPLSRYGVFFAVEKNRLRSGESLAPAGGRLEGGRRPSAPNQ
jgi:hypothetical protein